MRIDVLPPHTTTTAAAATWWCTWVDVEWLT